jgi:hypothetical protein
MPQFGENDPSSEFPPIRTVTPLRHVTSANIESSIFGDVTSANAPRIGMTLKLFF